MKNNYLPIVALMLHIFTISGFSQNCNCDFIIDTSLANGISIAPWRTGIYHFNPPPGSTVCLKGIYKDLLLTHHGYNYGV